MFNDILIFIQLVEMGSFTKAAQKLNTTQATVSRRMQELERELGLALVTRNTRGLEITPVGMDLYIKLKDSEQHMKNVIDEIKNSNDSAVGRIRVSLASVVAFKLISPYIPKFLRDNPGITLETYYQSHPVDLVKEPFDIAITSELPKQLTTLTKKLATFKLKLFCTPSYAEKYGIPTTVEELKKHQLPGALYGDFTTSKVVNIENEKTGKQYSIEWESRIFLNSGLHSLSMALSGEIICGTWETLIQDELDKGILVPILPDYILSNVSFYQIRRPNVKSKVIDIFCDFIQECFDCVKK